MEKGLTAKSYLFIVDALLLWCSMFQIQIGLLCNFSKNMDCCDNSKLTLFFKS